MEINGRNDTVEIFDNVVCFVTRDLAKAMWLDYAGYAQNIIDLGNGYYKMTVTRFYTELDCTTIQDMRHFQNKIASLIPSGLVGCEITQAAIDIMYNSGVDTLVKLSEFIVENYAVCEGRLLDLHAQNFGFDVNGNIVCFDILH